MRIPVLLPAVALASLLCACSSRVTTEPGGMGGAAGASGAGGAGGATGSGGGGSGGEGGWTECSSPDGFRICGGPAACPTDGDCVVCFDEELALAGGVSTCATPAMIEFGVHVCYLCPDGDICVSFHGEPADGCAPFNLGVLYAQAGAADNVSYADAGSFTGEPLPEPTTCPVIDGVTICGGHCGGCVPGSVCTGRSPLHPYGMCLPKPGTLSCELGTLGCTEPGEACFVYTVDPEAQPWADQNGYCLPLAACQAAASNLPGGGTCVDF